ncbi:MAG: ATP-binding cassette domain-containing protein, partial [Desulfuromonadales bacterium]
MKQKNNLQTEPLLRVEKLVVEYVTGRNRCVHAVSGISFDIARGEIFGLVGESGCGKTSVAKAIMQLPRPTAGKVLLNGVEL